VSCDVYFGELLGLGECERAGLGLGAVDGVAVVLVHVVVRAETGQRDKYRETQTTTTQQHSNSENDNNQTPL